MSIRVKLDQNLLGKMRSKLRGESTGDIICLVDRAIEEQGSLENIHNAIKSGTEYSLSRGIGATTPAETSIVDMNGTMYLLTDRLMEIDSLIEFGQLTKYTYQIKNSNWE